MDLKVGSVVIDVNDSERMRSFWQAALGYEVEYDGDAWTKLAPPGGGVNVSLQKVPEKKSEKNRLHLDLYSSHMVEEMKRLVTLGATVEQGPRDDKDFVVLADPEGNLFCIIDQSRIP